MGSKDTIAKIVIVLGILISISPQLGTLLHWQDTVTQAVVQMLGAVSSALGGLTHTTPGTSGAAPADRRM